MAGTIECCLFCGRDTRDRSRICHRCLNGETQAVQPSDDCKNYLPAEDDYSDESGPDSICDDHIGADAFPNDSRWLHPGKRRGRQGRPL